jgi:hypothetical protein
MIHYLAYGSNLHPLRLTERVPSATLVGPVTIAGYRLVFHKKGRDDSGKCDLLCTGVASDLAYGALYAIEPAHKPHLDRFEGRGRGYLDHPIDVPHEQQNYRCFTYFAQQTHIDAGLKPYHWYKELVILGARHLGFPDDYIRALEKTASAPDHDDTRRKIHESLIEKIVRQTG